MFRMSVAHKAESLYEIDERDKLRSFLKDAIRIDQSNIRLASLSAFISNQYEEFKRSLSVPNVWEPCEPFKCHYKEGVPNRRPVRFTK